MFLFLYFRQNKTREDAALKPFRSLMVSKIRFVVDLKKMYTILWQGKVFCTQIFDRILSYTDCLWQGVLLAARPRWLSRSNFSKFIHLIQLKIKTVNIFDCNSLTKKARKYSLPAPWQSPLRSLLKLSRVS